MSYPAYVPTKPADIRGGTGRQEYAGTGAGATQVVCQRLSITLQHDLALLCRRQQRRHRGKVTPLAVALIIVAIIVENLQHTLLLPSPSDQR